MRFTTSAIGALCLSWITPALCQSIEPFSLKGYTLGQEMAQCPPETRGEETRDRGTMCNLGPTTLANQPAEWHAVLLIDGRVASVVVKLPRGGPNAHSSIRGALIEKFGQPTSSKPHVNEARWDRGDSVLSFDGYRGTVLTSDLAANRRRSGEAAKENKKDL
jgi:hypothetical protein